jgi:hypothetical protein
MRKLFITLFIALTCFWAHGQSPAAVTDNISRIFGNMPLDSSLTAIMAWCDNNGFTSHHSDAYPYMSEFRKSAAVDNRFDNAPDSTYTYLSIPGDKVDSSSHIAPNFSFMLVYKRDGSGRAGRQFKAFQELFRKWTGNLQRSQMVDRYGKYRKWKGYMSWGGPSKTFPMLTVTWSVSNDQRDKEVITIFYMRKWPPPAPSTGPIGPSTAPIKKERSVETDLRL